MAKYIFKKIRDPENKFDNVDLEMTVDTISKNEIIDAFREFLLGCGYQIDLLEEVETVTKEEKDDLGF